MTPGCSGQLVNSQAPEIVINCSFIAAAKLNRLHVYSACICWSSINKEVATYKQ